ncbi:MAG: hypothetical protein R3281_02305 [Balneolaceae bacterium]|nr:hypothetical protein [Balneolaceae bacterium]
MSLSYHFTKRIFHAFGFIIIAVLLVSGLTPEQVQAQDDEEPLYLVFEFMKVDNEQESAYAETEQMWRSIHQERVKSGEIIGWDLWSLQPGGEMQGYQYLTVTLFDDPAKMFGDPQMGDHARAAYPDLSDEEISNKFSGTAASRDLAERFYLEQIASTEGDFQMNVGTVASIDFMKVKMDNYPAYEQSEMEIFKPFHQQMIDNSEKGSWGLLRIMNPIGSDTYASHITVNMYENWQQVFSGQNSDSEPESSFSEDMMVQKGLETRDMKWVYMATLRDMVR